MGLVQLVKHPSLSATKLLVLEEEVEVELEEELLVLLEELLVDVEDVDVEDVDVEDVDVVLEELVDVEEVEEELVDVEDVEVELLEEVLVEVEVEEVEVELLEEVVVSGDPKIKPKKKNTVSRTTCFVPKWVCNICNHGVTKLQFQLKHHLLKSEVDL